MNYQMIKKDQLNEEEYLRLIELSKIWVEEDISYGMVTNEKEDIKFPCFLALVNDIIVGYTFGHYITAEKKLSPYINIGDKYFYIDEIYVHPTYRSCGIGKALFKAIEDDVKGNVSYITLVTSTKDYQKVFKFYDKENAMTFHDAYFVKKL